MILSSDFKPMLQTVFHKLQVTEGESRVSQLQREVDRLNEIVLKAQEGESALKEKAASLSQTLQEVTASHSGMQSRLLALQKTVLSTEQDKRLLQVCGSDRKSACD